ncbi:hypothetical protein BBP40_004047 [Aspergillus hancockii]|nr:hypothetical protein BBP40_004047 [Aspergillus hancockii]
MSYNKNSSIIMTSPLPLTATLEALIPGYSLLVYLTSFIFTIDASSYMLTFGIPLVFLVYAVPVFWDHILSTLLRFATSVEIPYHTDLYDGTLSWTSGHPDLRQTRQSTADTKPYLASHWSEDEWDENNSGKTLSKEDELLFKTDPLQFWIKQRHQDRLRTIHYTPAHGQTHLFKYKGCWFAFRREAYRDNFSPWAARMEKLYLYVAPWKMNALRDLLDNIQKDSIKKDNHSMVIKRGLRIGSTFQWKRAASKKPRPLSTIFLDPDLKTRIINDVQNYLLPGTRSWYQSRGLPYRRGYLFYGPPGTGKSSLCLGIASLVQLDIFVVSLTADGLDENSLALLFQELPTRCIVLFEDVDQAGILKRKTENSLSQKPEETYNEESRTYKSQNHNQSSNGITLSAFLNIIDGVSAQEGRILIMTTNHVEQLDPALLRPGRVDMQVFFGRADRLAYQEQFLLFYSGPADGLFMGQRAPDGSFCPSPTLTSAQWGLAYITKLSTTFAEKIPPYKYTAAEVQNYLLQYKNSPDLAVNDATEWSNKHLHLDWDEDLHRSRILGDGFIIHGTTYHLRVSAYIFIRPSHNPCLETDCRDGMNDSFQPRVLLLQRALQDSKPGYWECPGGGVDGDDKTLKDALGREVFQETGLQLSRIVHFLPMHRWITIRNGERFDWIGYSCIVAVSQSEIGWEKKIKLNPKEHQAFTWATEDEVKDNKCRFYGEHRSQILKAFTVINER